MRLPHVLLAIVVAGLVALPSVAQAAPGDLDSSFGTGGKTVTDLGGEDFGRDVVVDSSGRIVVVGDSELSDTEQEAVVIRYTAAGALDPTFGGDGNVQFHFGTGLWDDAAAVAIDGSGRIVIAGETASNRACDDYCNFAVARLTNSGQFDPTFGGGDGLVMTTFSGSASAVAIDGSGRILVSGWSLVLRFTASGVLDASFSGDGMATSEYGAYGMALDSAGRIVTVGGFGVGVGRLLDTGTLDATFSDDGLVGTHIAPGSYDYPSAVAVDASNRVLVVGLSALPGEPEPRLFLLRLTASGVLDSSLAGDGILLGDIASWANDIAVDAAGRLLVVGYWPSLGASGDVLIRYLPDGSFDPSFGSGAGFVSTPVGQNVTTDPEQRIVVAGSWYVDDLDFAVARHLTAAGSSPPSPPETPPASSSTLPPVVSPPPPGSSTQATKPKKCKRGFRKKTVRGKRKCVKRRQRHQR